MNEKWNYNWFDKDYYKSDKYHSYDKLLKELGSSYSIDDLLGGYKSSDWNTYKPKREETPQEREARLLREKAEAREAKIDLILKK
jgi:hypothetical protein